MSESALIERPREPVADYQLRFEPYPHRVRVELGGVVVADSTRAMVMHETRLDPVHYFPREDVRTDLMTRTAHVTHCPFKGNATYWTLRVGDDSAENVAWSYEEPLEEAARIAGYIAFYRNRLDGWYEDGQPVGEAVPAPPISTNPLVRWLLSEAPTYDCCQALTGALAEQMVEVGMPLSRMTVVIRTLHPLLIGFGWRWWRTSGQVTEAELGRSVLHSPEFLDSPLVSIFDGAGGIRRRLDVPDPVLDFGILRELHGEGATDYVAMPMQFSDGQINAVTLASNRAGGFTTADLGHIYEILPTLGRFYEVHAARRRASTLLDTYLGHHAGERVLNGQIRRGDGERIRAVIWFCDLRGSTTLARTLTEEQFLGALNQYFDCMAGTVLEHGGQVLRFIGDAALAIFPVEDDSPRADARACRAAATAARDAAGRMTQLNERRRAKGWDPLGYGIGLHLGDVTYGNIGTQARLEFTVVGDAANVAARIESLSKEIGEPVVASDEVARHLDCPRRDLGEFELRGAGAPRRIHALDIETG